MTTVRTATPDDYPEIAEMLREFHTAAGQSYTAFDEVSAYRWVEHLATLPIGTVFVAEAGLGDRAGPKLRGVIAGVVVPVFVNAGQIMAQESFWWVRPEARRTGAGLALLQALEEWAIERGAKTLTMVSFHGSHHEAVNALYEARGYRPFEYHYIRELAPCATP